MMYGHEKSDLAIVAVKPTNKAERSAAELVERRAGIEGNANRQSMRGLSARFAQRWDPYGNLRDPEMGAVRRKAACTDVCGGSEVTRVPTANFYLLYPLTA
jgi:hypothetical protein